MKTVKGEVIARTPISISKASSILSNFVSADTGASQAVCAYLRRASVSLNELNQLHKELKSHRKHKIPKSESVIEDGEPTRSFISNQPDVEVSERKKQKQQKKKEERGWFGNLEKSEWESVDDKFRIKVEESELGVDAEIKKRKKKRGVVGNSEEAKGNLKIDEEDGNVGMEDNERKKHKKNKGENEVKIGYLEEGNNRIKIEEDGDMGMKNGRKKHKKKRETSGFEIGDLKENGGGIVIKEEEKKKKKKRKSEEIEEGRETNSEESRSKKKKKRKSEGES